MKKIWLILTLISSSMAFGQAASVVPLLSKDLVGVPGKEATMITVSYAPGASDPVHRHNAQVFVYVLEGAIVMQVKGQQQVTLHPGQTFYEGPDDVHLVGRNASTTRPAKFLVFFVKDKGSPILVPGK
jgi:quercetin dioxygenase-like cupin family protein